MHYFASFLVLQSSWRGWESWLLCFYCFSDVLLLLMFCGSYSWCRGLVCSLWLWHLLFHTLVVFSFKKASAYDQEMPQSHTQTIKGNQPTLFPSRMIAKLERTQNTAQQILVFNVKPGIQLKLSIQCKYTNLPWKFTANTKLVFLSKPTLGLNTRLEIEYQWCLLMSFLLVKPKLGVWCLSVAGPTVAQLEVFFSSDYLWVMSHFLCFIMVC